MPRKTLRVRKLISILKQLDPEGEVFLIKEVNDNTLSNARVSTISYVNKNNWVESENIEGYPNKGVLLWS